MNSKTEINYKRARTPKKITKPIQGFCHELVGKKSKPIFIKVTPEDNAEEGNCFQNVHKNIQRYGGSIQHGWIIWYDPKQKLLISEFHALWVNESGEWLDITPRKEGRILFLADHERIARPFYKPDNEYKFLA